MFFVVLLLGFIRLDDVKLRRHLREIKRLRAFMVDGVFLRVDGRVLRGVDFRPYPFSGLFGVFGTLNRLFI